MRKTTEPVAVPVALVFGVVFVWILADNLLYTSIAPYPEGSGVGLRLDVTLFVFGVGIAVTGTLIDRSLRRLALASTGAFIVAGPLLLVFSGSLLTTLVAAVLRGVAFGGG